MQPTPTIYWFRDDLRLQELPGLADAAAAGNPVLACYVLDDETAGDWSIGSASRWWLHRSLEALSASIAQLGGTLYCARGRPEDILAELAELVGASQVFCSRQYEPGSAAQEQRVNTALQGTDASLTRCAGSLLWEPDSVTTQSGTPFKVFTPFWRACRALPEPSRVVDPVNLQFWCGNDIAGADLASLDLEDNALDSEQSWSQWWQPGEQGAEARLREFLDEAINQYTEGRDFPNSKATSLLSPHLHFGEISPTRVFHVIREAVLLQPTLESEAEKFLSEIGWREFSRHLLYHNPQLPEQAFRPEFEQFPWCGSLEYLKAWQAGRTGYPIVDAGMRELRQTGYMHNRVRMVAASFLCKHLLIDWRVGERWFWDTLVDADLASNASNWQWVAGSGADASPYFRIFNPIIQGIKFDKAGAYVRRWVPELSALPDRYIHQPWTAAQSVLDESNLGLGADYPYPIVDHKAARESALAAYAQIRNR
jgi:deoxyribodipyrimidine photo-lyase